MSLEIENIDDFEPEKTQSIELEEYGVWVKKETPEFADTSLIDNDIFDSNIFLDNPEEKITSSDEETSKEEKIEEIIIDETSQNFEPVDETNEIFDNESISQETTDFSENEIENISTTENQSSNSFDIPDFENLENIDLSDFMSDFDATPKSNSTEEKLGSSTTSEEINLDDFGVDFSNSEFVSLDDFITPTEEKNDIIGDEPLDIELTFDDTYMSTTGANPLDEMETDIPEGFLPSNDDILDNFDDIFENVTDISEPEPSPEPIVTESVSFDEVSEFDDLLFALEDTPQSTETIVSKEKVIETSQYDITVNLDEDEIETTSTPQIEDDEEDFNISLYSDDKINEDDSSKTQNQENTLEVFPMINDNNAFFSIDDLDDSISFVDETPVENNSTSEDFTQENTDFPIENTFLDENIENFSDPSVENSITEESEEAFGFEEPILDAEDFPTFEDNSFLETTDMVAESFDEPIFEESIPEEPVAETTEDAFAFEESIVEEPVAESTEDAFVFEETIPEEPVAETTEDAFAFEDPMAEEPVAESTEDAFSFESDTIPEEPLAESTEDAFTFEESIAEEPVAESTEDSYAFESDTIAEEPVAESTEDAFAFEEPITEEPVAESTEDAFAFEEPIAEEPVAETSEDAFAFEEPMAEEPVAETTEDAFAFEEPIAEEPVAETTEDAFAFEEPMAEEPVAETTEDAFSFEESIVEEPVAETTEDAFAFEDPMAEEPVVESTEDAFSFEEPMIEETVAESTEDAFSFEEPMAEEPLAETTEDAFAFEEPMTEEPVAESTEDAFAFEEPMAEEPVAETTEDAFAFEEPIAEEPVAESTEDAFAFEEPMTEEPVAESTEDAFAFESDTIAEEPVAESTDDAFAFEESIPEEPVAETTEDVFAFEDPIAEEPVAEEPVAESTEDAFSFESDTIAEEPVAESTEEDEDPFAIDVEQELNESFLEQDAIPENEDINFQDSLPTVASITAAATMGAMAFSSSNEVIENEPQPIENPEKAEDKSMNSMSNSLLEKIVNELTELRAEMASIKEELNTIKTSPEDSIEEEIEIVEDKEVSTGFFSDEEDDDTIALSGDELNNILNCADFTEETQEEVSDDFSNEVSDDISINEENYTNDGALIIEESSIENQDNESETEIVIDEEIAEEQNDDSVEENTTSKEEFNTDIEDSTLVDEKVQIELNEDDEDEIQPDEILDDSNDSFYEGEIDLPVLDISGETIRDPELEKINFELDEQENEVPDELPDELAIPQLDDDFVVDSSSTDLLEESIIETKPADLDEINDKIMAALDEEDEIDDAPTTEVFNSQWNSFESSNNGDNPITITAEEIDFARRKAESETENPQPVENSMPVDLKKDVKSVLEYMDKLLANLPDEKIDEFAKSEHFEVYKKLFTELGLA